LKTFSLNPNDSKGFQSSQQNGAGKAGIRKSKKGFWQVQVVCYNNLQVWNFFIFKLEGRMDE
jgi:hypothetical protein